MKKKLAALESQVNYLKDEKESIHKKLSEANKQKREAQIQAAESKARLDEINKRDNHMQKRPLRKKSTDT